jgi:hypothetical protein
MATAPAVAGPQGVKPRREYERVKAPALFKFTKQGDTIEGGLASIEPKEVNGKIVREFLFELENGDRLTCLSTNDLDKKIQAKHIGHPIRVRYTNDDTSYQKAGQSPAKLFDVDVDMKNFWPGYEDMKAS